MGGRGGSSFPVCLTAGRGGEKNKTRQKIIPSFHSSRICITLVSCHLHSTYLPTYIYISSSFLVGVGWRGPDDVDDGDGVGRRVFARPRPCLRPPVRSDADRSRQHAPQSPQRDSILRSAHRYERYQHVSPHPRRAAYGPRPFARRPASHPHLPRLAGRRHLPRLDSIHACWQCRHRACLRPIRRPSAPSLGCYRGAEAARAGLVAVRPPQQIPPSPLPLCLPTTTTTTTNIITTTHITDLTTTALCFNDGSNGTNGRPWSATYISEARG